MFFDSWPDLFRVIIVGALAYVALVLVLRLSGKRTLAKMNAFDLVVTMALGSTLATVLLSRDVSLAEGVSALALLALLQFLIAWSASRFRPFAKLVKSDPRLLLADGNMIDHALRDERISRDEVLAAIRSAGIGDIDDVAAVFLETDGSLSVISQSQAGTRSAWPDGANR